MHASILGFMLPGAKWPSAMRCLASSSVIWAMLRCVGLPKSSATCSTPVLIKKRSAPIRLARKLLPKSLSTTAAMPRSSPLLLRVTGMPPPPAAITIHPAATASAMAASSMISTGCGEAITRRHPRPASSTTCHPSASKRRAVASSRKLPMGLVGF